MTPYFLVTGIFRKLLEVRLANARPRLKAEVFLHKFSCQNKTEKSERSYVHLVEEAVAEAAATTDATVSMDPVGVSELQFKLI